ncbi:hypothetical protein SAMD00019534_037390 [Acytostelium subglobosum LB1]|uniref:hypothetical protein n=1 Tax=Acytostelium subglobosum LB1 TaxID=1410327 RepID=UPI000644B897|nr:hypothetical protein SAMD00019534_037390 [Acytostelium subglobosum LB1]GAM20564.1 hypothetical protein SAMD00019534_037390 [Acytostelium subglobosum LB1]|eukprot:XP_012760085.1 hypothetical protein SAMD00019534_037390 [Acytostelium subglobosum LB1]
MVEKRKQQQSKVVATTTSATTSKKQVVSNIDQPKKKTKNVVNETSITDSIMALGGGYDDDVDEDYTYESKYYNDEHDDDNSDDNDDDNSDDDDDVMDDDTELPDDHDYIDGMDDDDNMMDDSERAVGGINVAVDKEAKNPRNRGLFVKSSTPTDTSRAVTSEEMQEFRETHELFNSNLFRLQIAEFFKELKVNFTKTTALESALFELKTIIESIPDQTVNVFSNMIESVKIMDIVGENIDLAFSKPLNVEIGGSYMIKTVIKSNPNVDMIVEIPETSIGKTDANNFKYFTKRNLYMWTLANEIRKHARFANVSFTHFGGDSNKQIIVVRPKEDATTGAHTKFTIRIIPCVSRSLFRMDTKFNPDANCIITDDTSKPNQNGSFLVDTYRDNDNDQLAAAAIAAESSDSSKKKGPKPFESIPRSAFYNNAILEDIMYLDHMNLINDKIRSAPVLVDTIQLLKAWLHVKNIPTINSFHLSMLVAYLYSIGRINRNMSTYQAFRMTLVFITKDFNKPLQFELEKGSTLTLGQYTDSFKKLYPVVLLDPTGLLNIFSRVTSWGFRELQREAATALRHLDLGDGFDEIFLIKTKPLMCWDYILKVKLSKECDMKTPATDYYHEEAYFDHRVYRTLYRALTNRARTITILPHSAPVWKFGAQLPESHERIINVGIQLDQTNWLRLVDMGPSADHKDADKFRKAWGPKSQLRRFKDGSIREAATWTPKNGQRQLIVEDIAKYILGFQLKVPATNVSSHISHFDRILYSANMDDRTLLVMRAKEALVTKIESLALPLHINEYMAMSPALRYTCVRTAQDDTYMQNTVIEVLLHFEDSRFWTSDVDSIYALKAAFMLKMARELTEQDYQPRLTDAYLDVKQDGFLFRLIPYYPKELDYLTSKHQDKLKSVLLMQRTSIHHKFVQALHTSNPSYGHATRLALRWCYAHNFTNQIAQPTIELMMASIYKPYTPENARAAHDQDDQTHQPTSPMLAFLRFLHLLATFEWTERPLIVDFVDSLTSGDVSSINSIFQQQKQANNLPMFFIATDKDRPSVAWKDVNPRDTDGSIRKRLAQLAKASLDICMEAYSNDQSQVEMTTIFEPNYTDYDVIITLNDQYIPDREREIKRLLLQPAAAAAAALAAAQSPSVPRVATATPVTAPTQVSLEAKALSLFKNIKASQLIAKPQNGSTATGSSTTNKSGVANKNGHLEAGLNMVEIYINKLSEQFKEYCTFEYDGVGGDKIGLKWKQAVLDPIPFKPIKAQYSMPIVEQGQIKLNIFELVHAISSMGGKLVKNVSFNKGHGGAKLSNLVQPQH